jgi:predicted Ser/Thr protein kinase
VVTPHQIETPTASTLLQTMDGRKRLKKRGSETARISPLERLPDPQRLPTAGRGETPLSPPERRVDFSSLTQPPPNFVPRPLGRGTNIGFDGPVHPASLAEPAPGPHRRRASIALGGPLPLGLFHPGDIAPQRSSVSRTQITAPTSRPLSFPAMPSAPMIAAGPPRRRASVSESSSFLSPTPPAFAPPVNVGPRPGVSPGPSTAPVPPPPKTRRLHRPGTAPSRRPQTQLSPPQLSSPPTLFNYLLPPEGFTAPLIPEDERRRLNRNQRPNSRGSSSTTAKAAQIATAPFSPGPEILDNRHKLPYYVGKAPNMISKMRDDLIRRLSSTYATVANDQASDRVRAQYLGMRDNCRNERLGLEPSVVQFANCLVYPARQVYLELTGNEFQAVPEITTTDGVVRTDHLLCRIVRDESQREGEDRDPFAFIEYKSVWCFDHYSEIILDNILSGRHHYRLDQSKKNGVPATKWEGDEAILAKLTWHAMNAVHPADPSNVVRWAMVNGGDQYMIFLIVYTLDEQRRKRPSLHCSKVMSIYDSYFPITTALLYMALTAKESQDSLCSLFDVSPPTPGPTVDNSPRRSLPPGAPHSPRDPPRSPPRQPPSPPSHYSYRNFGHAVRDASEILLRLPKRTSRYPLTRQLPTPPTRRLPARRLNQQKAPRKGVTAIKKDLKNAVTVTIDPTPVKATTATVHRTIPRHFIVKLALPNDIHLRTLQREVDIYELLSKKKPRPNVPAFYGAFTSSGGPAIIISDEGEPLKTFDTLTEEQKKSLLNDLEQLHSLGIEHGDFAPRNVVMSERGRPVIIDFSHAVLDHTCPGRDSCEELLHALDDPNSASETLSTSTSIQGIYKHKSIDDDEYETEATNNESNKRRKTIPVEAANGESLSPLTPLSGEE